jgi:hypothetical protein
MNIQGNWNKERKIQKWKRKKHKENPLRGIQMFLKVSREIELHKGDWIRFTDGSLMRINNKTYPVLQKNPDKNYRVWCCGMWVIESRWHPSLRGSLICKGWIDGIEVEVWRRSSLPNC